MYVALKDLGLIITGNTPSKKELAYWASDDICFVKPDVLAGEGITFVNAGNEYIAESARAKARIVNEGTVFVTCIGNIGNVGIAGAGEYAFNQQINAVVPNNDVVPRYLAYSLLFSKPKLEAIANAPVVPIINKSQFGEFTVRFEKDKGKQKAIVEVLDRVSAVVGGYVKELRLLDELVKARFVEMFGDPEFNTKVWPMCSLGSVCKVGSSKRIYQNEQSQDGVPFWRISDLVNKMDTGVADSGLFIPEEKYKELKEARLVPVTGDILVTSRGTLGRCYIVKDEDCFYFQDGMISWLSDYVEDVTPLYLQFLFTMPGFRKQIDSTQTGSTVSYLSIAMLKKLQIMMPSKDVQESFETFVAKVDKSKVAVQKSLDEAQLLFDSLMQKYFG